MTAALRHVAGPLEVRRHAEALARAGRLIEAAAHVDGFLARNDGGWHLWRLCAELSSRLGRTGPAVAAYRACARQLEAAGHLGPAAAMIQRALALAPHEGSLGLDLERLLTAPLPGGPAQPSTVDPGPTRGGQHLAKEAPQRGRPVHPPTLERSPAHDVQRPAKGPPLQAPSPEGRTPSRDVRRLEKVAPRPALPLEPPPLPPRRARLESVTDPHLAIFDILDDEARTTERAARPGRPPRHR